MYGVALSMDMNFDQEIRFNINIFNISTLFSKLIIVIALLSRETKGFLIFRIDNCHFNSKV